MNGRAGPPTSISSPAAPSHGGQPGGTWEPTPAYKPLTGWLAVYPSRVDRCSVDGEEVRPQDGDFYGGWITARVVGPFKGEAGTLGW